jgi:death-on-curing family protein
MLGPQYVEHIHDELVTRLWPGGDPVAANEYRSRGLLSSATARPFHSAFGRDAYSTVIEKAAALFHSLISNHPFHNGNKRTAVLAFDIFLVANGYFGLLTNDRMYKLAAKTASYRERGLSHQQSMSEILNEIRDLVIPLAELRKATKEDQSIADLYKNVLRARRLVRKLASNQLIESS